MRTISRIEVQFAPINTVNSWVAPLRCPAFHDAAHFSAASTLRLSLQDENVRADRAAARLGAARSAPVRHADRVVHRVWRLPKGTITCVVLSLVGVLSAISLQAGPFTVGPDYKRATN